MNRTWHSAKTAIPAERRVHCNVATTTSGTLAATQQSYGLTLTKTATKTGRLTCQLVNGLGAATSAKGFIGVQVLIVGPDDTAMTDAKGIFQGVVRDIDIGAGADDGTVEIQFQDADSGADAEVQDGASIYVTLTVNDSLSTF